MLSRFMLPFSQPKLYSHLVQQQGILTTRSVLIRSVVEADVECLTLRLEGNGKSIKLCFTGTEKGNFEFSFESDAHAINSINHRIILF
jgi:hypothetical protein